MGSTPHSPRTTGFENAARVGESMAIIQKIGISEKTGKRKTVPVMDSLEGWGCNKVQEEYREKFRRF